MECLLPFMGQFSESVNGIWIWVEHYWLLFRWCVYNNWHGFISSDSTDIGIELVETECENASFQYFSLSLPLSFLPSFLLSPRLENSKNTSNDILIWLRRLLLTKCWTRTAARVLPCRRRRCARPAHYSPSRLQPLLSPTLEARSIRTAVCSWPQSSRLLFPTRYMPAPQLINRPSFSHLLAQSPWRCRWFNVKPSFNSFCQNQVDRRSSAEANFSVPGCLEMTTCQIRDLLCNLDLYFGRNWTSWLNKPAGL